MRDKAIVCVCRHLRIQLVAGPQSAFICSTARGRRPRRLQWSHTMRGQSLTTSIELARAALYIYICRSSGLSLPLKRPPLCSCYTLPPPSPHTLYSHHHPITIDFQSVGQPAVGETQSNNGSHQPMGKEVQRPLNLKFSHLYLPRKP